MEREQISVIGSGDASENARRQAYRIGNQLGNAGITMVCGGGKGVMEAVSRGVQESDGGLAVGIRPEFDDRSANQYLDVVIPSGLGQGRNVSVVSAGAAIIAVEGRYGTLTELAYARKFGKPVFGVGTWEHSDFDFDSDLEPDEAVDRALKVLRG